MIFLLVVKTLYHHDWIFQVIEGFIRAWKNDNLSFDDFGINANFIQSKTDDLFVGEPGSFQNELLNGIEFIQVRDWIEIEPMDLGLLTCGVSAHPQHEKGVHEQR